jgi:TolB protein
MIVFTEYRGDFGEIWTMDESGGSRRRLTRAAPLRSNAYGSANPRWSPDGNRIAFVSTAPGSGESQDDLEIYVMEADGTRKRRLTDNRVADWDPEWSPDGRQIVFVRAGSWNRRHAESSLNLVNAEGSGERLLRREENGIVLIHPAWSPDGTTIAFTRVSGARAQGQSLVGAVWSVYSVSSDGARSVEVAKDASEPAWSPDGRQIAFSGGPGRDIYVADPDGSSALKLTDETGSANYPDWSSDGRTIVFVATTSADAQDSEIYTVDAKGGSPNRITSNDVPDREPDWRPD